MSQWKSLKVDILKVIEDFVEMYPYSPPECVVVEGIANGLDAKATKISISLVPSDEGKKILRIIDNGKGMSKEEFEENYHALSVSSKAKGEGIGFAGVGSKLYLAFLAAGENIITETKSDTFNASSVLTIINKEPKWDYIERKTLIENGTLYEVKLNPTDANSLTVERIINIVQAHYNAILLGRYGDKLILLDGERIRPWKPELENREDEPIIFRIKGKEFKCYFWQTKEDLTEKEGLEIVVYGKAVKTRQWFDLDYVVKAQFRKKITGQILADGLAVLLTTDKSDFRFIKAPRLWASFRNKAIDTFGDWLEKINVMEQLTTETFHPGLELIRKSLEKEIGKLLRDPAFLDYNPFLKRSHTPVLIESEEGELKGETVSQSQTTSGTLGGLGLGQGVEVVGPNEGKSLIESETGESKGEVVVRTVRHGIRINYVDKPEKPEESWLTSEAIVINTGHPVALKCGVMGHAAEQQHFLRCIFLTLLEQRPPQTFKDGLSTLREFYKKWSTI